MQNKRSHTIRRVVTLTLFVLGIALVGFSLSAELLGLNFTVGFGVVQIAQLLAGLTCLTISGFIHIHSLRGSDTPRSLQADIGVRLAATGLVFAYVAGFSDSLQIGTHINPRFERPFLGPWQLTGILLGIISITIGMVLYHTSRGTRKSSSLSFIFERDEEETAQPQQASAPSSTE